MTITSTATDVGPDAERWVENNLIELRERLAAEGVLRLRGLGSATERFDSLVTAITESSPVEYQGGATPRTRVDRNVYSSTDFPSQYAIDLHSEMAYAATWPIHLAFCCVQPSATGGATPLASTTEIAERLPADLASRLRRHGVRYRRAFHPMLGTDWRAAYGVDDLDALAAEAEARGETLTLDDDVVATEWTLPAYLGGTGSEHWFNQLVAFNVSTLPTEVHEDLVLVVGEKGIPKNTLVGDGTPLGHSDIDTVRAAVDAASIAVPWEAGDLTIVDNRRFAHGREPYSGSRQVRVCMTGEGTWE